MRTALSTGSRASPSSGSRSRPTTIQPNLLLIHVDYVVRATNSFYNRVYPFYLLEGRP